MDIHPDGEQSARIKQEELSAHAQPKEEQELNTDKEEKQEAYPEIKEKHNEQEMMEDQHKTSTEQSDDDEEEPVIEQLDPIPLYRNPTFAEICSFFNMFTPLFGFKPISIATMERMFCTLSDGDVCRELIDLHVTLMRKIYLKSARVDKWEQSLQKFCSIAPGLEAELRQLQRNNYVSIPLGTKLTVLKALCDSQFDCNLKFKENVANSFRHNELRIAPIGTDKRGQLYYFQLDCTLEFRVYSEETDDMAGVSWTLRAKTELELEELIEKLRNPEYSVVTKEEQEEDDDIDEEQLLGQPKSNHDAAEIRPSSAFGTKPHSQVYLSDEEKSKVHMAEAFCIRWDHYYKESVLNKRKTEKEKRKPTPAIHVNDTSVPLEIDGKMNQTETKNVKTGSTSQEVEKQLTEVGQSDASDEKMDAQQENTPELDEALLARFEEEEQRRVLPRRNARNTAIQNLKVLTGSPRRHNRTDSDASGTPPIGYNKKLGFAPATADSCTEDEENDDDSDDDDGESEEDSSDDDFLLHDSEKSKRKVGRPPAEKTKARSRKTINKRKKEAPPKGKKAGTRGHRIGRMSSRVHIKKHPTSINFMEEESSENEEEITAKSQRERKKASEETFCQICKESRSPDLLLLCDSCDTAWHTFCLRPQLWFVPDGDWFCPICEHATLVRRLAYALMLVREEKKNSEAERKKKEAAERLKREMDYIGISLNNIIPLALKKDNNEQTVDYSSSSENDGRDGEERQSKKRAMKIVMSRTREKRRAEKFYGPIITVAEGRSRRALNKVDYNFHAYDEQLQEAVESASPDTKDGKSQNAAESTSAAVGADHGKEKQNIYERENKQQEKSSEELNEGERRENAPARPPNISNGMKNGKKGGRKSKRLTDLDIDNATESDSDEWRASSADEVDEDPEPSEDEYLPSEKRISRGIGFQGRHQSDDDFINDDSDSDYLPSRKNKRGSGKQKGGKGRRRIKKSKNAGSSTSEEDEEFIQSGSDSEPGPSNKKKKLNRKWKPKASSSEEEEDDEEKAFEKCTETGRPLRRAAVIMRKKLKEELEDEEDEGEEEEEEKDEAKVVNPMEDGRLADRAVSALARPLRREIKTTEDGDADEFKPDEEDEAEADEEEEEAEKEEAMEEVEEEEEENVEEPNTESTSEDEEEDDEGPDEAPSLPPKKETTIVRKQPKKSVKSRKKLKTTMQNTASMEKTSSPLMHTRRRKSVEKYPANETIDTTSKKTAVESVPQRQTRQQLKKQQSLQENAMKESQMDMKSKDANAIIPQQTEGQHQLPLKNETTLENSERKEKSELKIPKEDPIKLSKAAVGIPLPKTNESKMPSSNNHKKSVTDGGVPTSTTLSTPSTSTNFNTATVYQQVQPQQLSQYFMRPTTAATYSRQQQQHQPISSSMSSTSGGERFQTSHPPTFAYAMARPPQHVGNVVTQPHNLIGNSQQFPPLPGAIPFATTAHSQPATTYFIQSSGAPPQIIYQTLQPFANMASHPTSQQQQMPGMDPDGSLSHALAGAMNPEDL